MPIQQINPVQRQSGGLFGKLAGGIGSLVGGAAGAIAGGPAGFSLGSSIGGTLGSAAGAIDQPKQNQSSALQSVSNSLDNQALNVVQARDTLNSSNVAEPDRLSLNKHLTDALDVINQRRKANLGVG